MEKSEAKGAGAPGGVVTRFAGLWQQVRIHHHKVAGASAHDKEVEDLMAAEIFMPAVEDRELQCIDHAADRVNNSSCQKPAKSRCAHGIEDLGECQHAGPSHADIQDRGYPLGTEHPKCLDQYACNGNAPDQGQQSDSCPALEHQQADGRVASCDQDEDHHVVDFFQ